jgi:hypothetical protein
MERGLGFGAEWCDGRPGGHRARAGFLPELEGDADMRGWPVSGRREGPRNVSVWSGVGPWTAFRLGPKCCPATFFCSLFFPFLFSISFVTFSKLIQFYSNQSKKIIQFKTIF